MSHRLLAALILTLIIAPSWAFAQEGKRADGLRPLDRFVGVWNATTTNKPTRSLPDGSKLDVMENTGWVLKDRFIAGREVSQPGGMKSLWLMTFDPKTNTCPFWYFNNRGVLGGEWENTWDEAAETLTGKATDTPKGWTSGATNQFSGKDSDRWTAWMKDDAGTLVFDTDSRKTRQPTDAGEKVLASWSRLDKADPPPPDEMKVLERLIGNWDATAVFKAAEWTPVEVRTTSKITRKWVLDGQFLQDSSEISDGTEGLSLLTYDPQMKAYRTWWFSSEGHTSKSTGSWDGGSATLSFTSNLDNGLTSQSSVHFIDKDHHDWKVMVKDADGKVYFHGEWNVTRRKE